MVLQCAASGYQSVGLELNALLVLYSRYKARRQHVAHLATFYRKDIFKADLSKYRSAVIFGAEFLMNDLVPKLDEMLVGSYLIACRFPLPSNTRWRLLYKVGEGHDTVWLFHAISMEYALNSLRITFGGMARPANIQSTRSRATYYQPSRRWPPRFIRRFMLRYPQGHLYIALGICSTGMVFPVAIWMYKALTMDKNEFIEYRNQYNAVVHDRQKYGRQLAFPFFFPSKPSVEKERAEQRSS
ncbi:putative rotein [Toxocara canis]|uniref:Putative rotein n=1 Tax=Toxocara canis TaxID=6265 RepID=A0A0B2VQS4_TOXCA|nr:putative rotein [Toxocara canis]